jgi:oxalate decarboxylase
MGPQYQEKHKFNVRDATPVFQNELGKIQQFTTEELPILKNLSLQRIELQPSAILEPKWFVNCNLLGYIIEGQALISILDTGSQMSAFTVKPGQMFHVESGALFHVENIVQQKVVLLFTMRHEHPKDFTLSNSIGAFTDSVLANTFDADSSHFAICARDPKKAKVIVKRDGPPNVPSNAHWPHPNRFDVEEMQAPTRAEGVGSAKKARSQYWKVLKNIAMYSLYIEENGMREVHWHPETGEFIPLHGSATFVYE